MPSPFPGMDPFLEHPEVFSTLHGSMIIYLQEFLQPRLPESYYAASSARVWIETADRYVEPDIEVLRRGPQATQTASPATAAVSSPKEQTSPVVIRVPHLERREPFLEIYTRRKGGDRLVTSIEILSPTNKRSGEEGRKLYLRKQGKVLASHTNLMEIDLLRRGRHTTAVPRKRLRQEVGLVEYHVCTHRFDEPEQFLIYPIRLEDRLPQIEVPLLPTVPAVKVDLQVVFDRCYDSGPYRRQVRYERRPPAPPLRPDQREWVAQRLREAGISTST